MPTQSEKRRKLRYTDARDRADKQSSGLSATFLRVPDGVTMFKPKVGTMLLDILPFVAGEGNPWADEGAIHWERTFWVHRGIGVNQDWYVCPAKTSRKRCPICEHRLKLMKGSDEEEIVAALAPSQRQIFNVVNLKEPDKGVQLWEISNHCFGKVLDATLRSADEEDDWGKFFFLEDGYSLRVSFVEDSFGGGSFLKAERIDFKPRREQYEEDKIDDTHPLDELLIELKYDELKKIFLSSEDEDEGDRPKKRRDVDGEDGEPEARRRRDDDEDDEPPKKKKPVEDDDDEPEARKKPKVEEDEDEPPKKKKAPVDEDDWDDFDDEGDEKPKKKKPVVDEDDEDEPPKKKNRFEDDDEDEKPRVRAGARDDDEDEDRPKKKKPPVDEDD